MPTREGCLIILAFTAAFWALVAIGVWAIFGSH